MKLQIKLFLCYLSFSMLILIGSLISYNQLNQLQKPLLKDIPESVEQLQMTNQKINLTYQLLLQHTFLNRNMELYVIMHDNKYLQSFYENVGIELELLEKAKLLIPDLYTVFTKQTNLMIKTRYEVINLMNSKQYSEAIKLLYSSQYINSINNITYILNDFYNKFNQISSRNALINVKIEEKSVNSAFKSSINLILFIFYFSLCLTVILSLIGAYTISRPIKLLRNEMQKITLTGDVESPLNPELLLYKSEIGELSKAFVILIENLRESRQLIRAANEASRLKNEFLSNMSHELRTPLNSVIGFTQLLLTEKDLTVEEQREYLNQVYSNSNHLLQIISDILDITEIESGKIHLHPREANVNSLINQVKQNFSPIITEKNISLSILIDSSINNIIIDDDRFKQVVHNYLSNAIKFSKINGNILIRVYPENKDYFILEVEDFGIGITKENLPKLFHVFQQIDMSTTKKYQGTGLGLALTRLLVETMNGAVWVKSEFDKGSRFFARFPFNVS